MEVISQHAMHTACILFQRSCRPSSPNPIQATYPLAPPPGDFISAKPCKPWQAEKVGLGALKGEWLRPSGS